MDVENERTVTEMAEYIELNAAITALNKVRDDQRIFKYATASDFLSARDAIERATKVLESLPAADVAPVRNGQWIMGTGENGLQTGHRECSRCGEIVKYGYSLYGVHNFCNYCGADMRGRTMDVMKGPIEPMGTEAKEDGRKEKENILCEMHC